MEKAGETLNWVHCVATKTGRLLLAVWGSAMTTPHTKKKQDRKIQQSQKRGVNMFFRTKSDKVFLKLPDSLFCQFLPSCQKGWNSENLQLDRKHCVQLLFSFFFHFLLSLTKGFQTKSQDQALPTSVKVKQILRNTLVTLFCPGSIQRSETWTFITCSWTWQAGNMVWLLG